ncbi:MAG TPA: hypothetical protein VHB79_00595 [Polyangiaceae bacterium]|nr:hypothetical protein [Polyangiaceae bacterium]
MATILLLQALSCTSTSLHEEKNVGGTSQDDTTTEDAASAAGAAAEAQPECLGRTNSPTDGQACGCDADCDSGQGCAPETGRFGSEGGPPGGRCDETCDDSSGCLAGFTCVLGVPGDERTGQCWKECGSSNDCRRGYVCGPFAILNPTNIAANLPTGNFCQPFCQSDADCPTTGMCNHYTGNCGYPEPEVSDIGNDCARLEDCGGACITQSTGGYCTAPCSLINPGCPEGAACVNAVNGGAGDFGLCFKRCQDDQDCRATYRCRAQANGDKVCQ